MSGILGGRWQLGELLAVSWNDDMAARFPNANHDHCRRVIQHGQVVACFDWHCNRCGHPTNSYGHHNCPDRPQPDTPLPPEHTEGTAL